MFFANDQVKVLRGTGTDAEGDEIDTDTPVHRHIPMSILEGGVRSLNPMDGRLTQVTAVEGLSWATVDIVDGDRLVSELTNRTFVVDSVVHANTPWGPKMKRFLMREIT